MILICGCSDDLVEINGDFEDEISSSHPVAIDVGWPEAAPGQNACGVRVVMEYAPSSHGAVWVATIGQFDEGAEIPWPVTVKNAPARGAPNPRSYSVVVQIDCPAGTPVKSSIRIGG